MGRKKIHRKKKYNPAIRILITVDSIILLAVAMLGPIYAFYVESVGGDLLDASLTGGALAVASGVALLLTGRLADRVKERELVVAAGYCIIGLGFLLFLVVQSIWALALVQVVIGLGKAIDTPAFDALFSSHVDRRRSGFQWGAWEAMNAWTTAAGAVIGGLVATYLGFPVLFVLMALLAFGSAAYIFCLPRKVL